MNKKKNKVYYNFWRTKCLKSQGYRRRWAHPALVVDEVPQWKIWELGEAEVVESLRKVLGFVSVLLLLIRWLGESAEEAWGPFGGGRLWRKGRLRMVGLTLLVAIFWFFYCEFLRLLGEVVQWRVGVGLRWLRVQRTKVVPQ